MSKRHLLETRPFLLCYVQQNLHPQSEQPATHEDLDLGVIGVDRGSSVTKKRIIAV